MSGRVKGKPRATEVDMGQRALREFQEMERRREQQATREQLEQVARRPGWTVSKEEQ